MAVTQQLARIPAHQLAACRLFVRELDELCSFRSAPPADYRDLNWWPIVLREAAELARLEPRVLTALRCGLQSDDEVNPAYRDWPTTVSEHPVTAVEPATVAEVAAELAGVDVGALRTAVEHDPRPIGRMFKGILDDRSVAAREAAGQFRVLRGFYAGAARRGLSVVQWWD